VSTSPSLRYLANIADWALGAAGGSGTLSTAALLGALQRQLSQAKGMVSVVVLFLFGAVGSCWAP